MARAWKKWTDTDLDFLMASFATLSAENIAKKLKRSLASVHTKAYEMGITKKTESPWTKAEIRILKKQYSKIGATKIKALLPGRTYAAITDMAIKNKITNKRRWSDSEIKIINNNSQADARSLLQNRTRAAIYTMACRLKAVKQ